MRQVVLDTETTGLRVEDGHRIIEIGCIELINRKFTGRKYHQYINPQREIEAGALAIHGLTQDFLQSKPTFIEIVGKFIEFIKGAELIIHNAPFDVGFINTELARLQDKWLPVAEHCRIFDTLALARQLHTGQRNSLDALCRRYHVDNSHRELHGALLDARLLAEVYLAMTGGQGNLFDELQIIETNSQQHVKTVPPISRSLLVLRASPKELAEHMLVLNKIAEKGQCWWLQGTD